MAEIVKIEAREEAIVLIGDLNKHLADTIVKTNKKITYGGKLLKEFLSDEKIYPCLQVSHELESI